ncbi:MAG: hypothetical protein WC693_06725 [Patescibacteria group bacterium]|jgi:hypothetical protein
MTNAQLLVGSLSNDLFRVATLTQRGSGAAAERFLLESKRWAQQLVVSEEKKYIRNIAQEIVGLNEADLDLAQAERCLMQAILLQNYSLHN